jgi:hypothetical protein
VGFALQHSLAQRPAITDFAQGPAITAFAQGPAITAFAHLGWVGIVDWVGSRIIHLGYIIYIGFKINVIFYIAKHKIYEYSL